MQASTFLSRTNQVLAALPDADRRRLAPFCELVSLPRGTVLYEMGDEVRFAYFPVSGMISLHAMTVGGILVQIAVIDRAGFVGVPALLDDGVTPYRTAVQLPCDAYRIHAATLNQEFTRNACLHTSILRFAHRHATHISDAAVCHYFHTVLQRLSRWLLVCTDCARSDTIELTQDGLAQMLGVPRPSVSRAATRLQDQDLIRQRYGHIRILNRAGLVACACECYESDRHLGAAPSSRR